MISRKALARFHSLCDFVNRWALAPGLKSLAKSLKTQPEVSEKALKKSAIWLALGGL